MSNAISEITVQQKNAVNRVGQPRGSRRRPHYASWLLAVLLAVFVTGCSQKTSESQVTGEPPVAQTTGAAIAEGLPFDRITRVRERDVVLKAAKPPAGIAPQFIVTMTKRWDPGAVVRVAFRGGTVDLQRKVAQTAIAWSAAANIGFDFGYDPKTGYRTWSLGDPNANQEIRIAFDASGYWSCIGTDSVDGTCAHPGETSMNFSRLDKALPQHWEGIVLHEFGHALGFQHEHQNPQGGCDAQMQWDPAVGYTDKTDSYGQFVPDSQGRSPGVYKFLHGPLNNWDRPTIDANMRQFPDSSAFETSAFDKQSIMKYSFPGWMYRDGEQSTCYSAQNDQLSSTDRDGVLKLYPRQPQEIITLIRQRTAAIGALKAIPALPQDLASQFALRMKSLNAIK